jgi:hypothetical protein
MAGAAIANGAEAASNNAFRKARTFRSLATLMMTPI